MLPAPVLSGRPSSRTLNAIEALPPETSTFTSSANLLHTALPAVITPPFQVNAATTPTVSVHAPSITTPSISMATSNAKNLTDLLDTIQTPIFGLPPAPSKLTTQHNSVSSPTVNAPKASHRIKSWVLNGKAQEVRELVDAFFTVENMMIVPFIHKWSFLASFETQSPLVLFSVCAFGAKYHPTLKHTQTRYYDHARNLLHEAVENPTVDAIQAHLLLTQYANSK
jgi:hypothetical protein